MRKHKGYKYNRWHRALLCATCLLWVCVGCREEVIDDFPLAPVRYELPLASSRYQALRTPGGIVRIEMADLATFQIGLGGLIVVRSLLEHNTFFVYDLACPVERSRSVRLQTTDTEAVCPSCRSHYDLLSSYGIPTQGVAKYPLKRYRAEYQPSRSLLLLTNQ